MFIINSLYRYFIVFALLLISFSIKANDETLADINSWLKEDGEGNKDSENILSYDPNYFALKSEDLGSKDGFIKPKSTINDYHFKEDYEKSVKINRANLSKKINQYFQFYLLKTKRNGNRHQIHIHTLERKFVAKGKQGRNKYELLLSPDKSKAKYSYTF